MYGRMEREKSKKAKKKYWEMNIWKKEKKWKEEEMNWNIQNSIKFDGRDNNLLIDTSFKMEKWYFYELNGDGENISKFTERRNRLSIWVNLLRLFWGLWRDYVMHFGFYVEQN